MVFIRRQYSISIMAWTNIQTIIEMEIFGLKTKTETLVSTNWNLKKTSEINRNERWELSFAGQIMHAVFATEHASIDIHTKRSLFFYLQVPMAEDCCHGRGSGPYTWFLTRTDICGCWWFDTGWWWWWWWWEGTALPCEWVHSRLEPRMWQDATGVRSLDLTHNVYGRF